MTPSAFGLCDVIDPPQPASKLDPLDLHEHSTVDHVNFETPRPSEVWGESTADGDYAQEMRDNPSNIFFSGISHPPEPLFTVTHLLEPTDQVPGYDLPSAGRWSDGSDSISPSLHSPTIRSLCNEWADDCSPLEQTNEEYMPHPSKDQGSPYNIVFISDNMPALPDHNEDLIAQHRSDPTNLLDASVNIIADLHALLSSAGTNVMSSVVTSDLHKVEQNATKTGNAHCIADAIVESNVDVQHIIDEETIQADREYDGHILVETPPSACLLSSSHQPGLQSRVKSQVRHKRPEVKEVQNQDTSATVEVSLRRSNRNRERTEATPSTTPIHSEQPLKRARIGNTPTPTGNGKTAAMVASKPKPIAMADGRFACPHCPAKKFERYHDCRRHIDMSKRCLGWNGILYPCRRCGKKYTRPDAAKRHMDDKPNCGQKGGRKKGGKKENRPRDD
ncbi:hypothetical protein POSPLADRAFT_1143125 [Postia placenta MAD-698-R-SB12]|uniref:C2H2-type domain-containing protein n=1 Tax=Postia placenta MAD-698-R-SB12 TaxID=670580 RepID=A0A1X6N0C2_9APHY|nr:hypothetical protein POSPLADRAFT_1143125 [Postia placenta MAD-698-R-SB12]OSX62065.1 hypothetical protein POSPLADRAFT_1143125 [Postia placenta MAD-698-R-SB12]